MSIPVTVIDYGIGNLLNVVRALEHCGGAVNVVQSASLEAAAAPRLVLPGVGAFGDGMAGLRARGFDDLVRRYADTGRPLLGICVGLQMLFDASEEIAAHAGLALLPGGGKAIAPVGADGQPHRIPHIGWRPLVPASPWHGSVLADLQPLERVYFVHSFSADPVDPAHRLADVDYDGVRICAAVRKDNIYGCQFHPERSGLPGLAMLRRFLAL